LPKSESVEEYSSVKTTIPMRTRPMAEHHFVIVTFISADNDYSEIAVPILNKAMDWLRFAPNNWLLWTSSSPEQMVCSVKTTSEARRQRTHLRSRYVQALGQYAKDILGICESQSRQTI